MVAEAKKNKKEVHMARVHGICVEKNYQLPEGNPGRKFKGRGVLLGNQVKNQHWEAAFFQDLGNSLHPSKPHDGPISSDVFLGILSSSQMQFKLISRRS